MKLTNAKIADLGKVVTGKTPSTKDKENFNGNIPFITPVDMTYNRNIFSTERCVSTKGAELVKGCILPPRTVCVSCIGSDMGKSVITTETSVTNQQINSIIVSPEYNFQYVYYLMRTLEATIKSLGKNGTAVPILSKSKFSDIEICVHDYESQCRIAQILSAYDDLIENNQKQIKLLEEAAQRLYKEWFVDLRFPGYEDVEVVDGVPEGWKKVSIEDVCDTIGGGTPSTKNDDYYRDGHIKWVTPTDITRKNSLILLDTEKRITEEGLRNSSAKMLPPYTILMTSRASVGFFGLCEYEVCTNQGFISCVPYKENLRFFLLYNLMERVDEIRSKAGGSTFLEISKKNFRELGVILPPNDILDLFSKIVTPIVSQIEIHTKSIKGLQEARDRLLPKLMSGEMEV